MDEKKIFLILDGNAILHRAYHALPPLTSKDGIPMGAVYGFFSMLLKLLADLKPSYIAVTFDRPKPTFRQTLFVGYQAQRPKMEDNLAVQIKILHELLEEARIAIFEVDGFEADDVIGTLAANAARINTNTTNKYQYQISNKNEKKENNLKFEIGNLKLEIVIVSGDRDLLQLVDDDTKILMPIIGITKMKLCGKEEVKEKYDLSPKQIVDFKALAGDQSDNYPGVHGVGPKTAVSLIKKYESVENIYSEISEIEKDDKKLAVRLAEGQEMAVLAKKLATLITDVPFQFKIENCSFEHLDKNKLISEFEKYDIKSLVKRVNGVFPEVAVKKNKKAKKSEGQMELLK